MGLRSSRPRQDGSADLGARLQGDVWICMELMDTSLDKFYRKVLDKNMTIPEDILGEIAVSVSVLGLVGWVRITAEAQPLLIRHTALLITASS